MRVIGGAFKGRRLRASPSRSVRPTSDRVREAVFDILASHVDIDGAEVVDLFAGSGAMGIEALSRGAGHVVFVERSAAALAVVRTNVTACGMVERATFVKGEALSWLGRPHHFDLALCDPPYVFAEWAPLLGRLDAEVAVLESGSEIVVPEEWKSIKSRRYGGTLVTVVRRVAVDQTDQEGSS